MDFRGDSRLLTTDPNDLASKNNSSKVNSSGVKVFAVSFSFKYDHPSQKRLSPTSF